MCAGQGRAGRLALFFMAPVAAESPEMFHDQESLDLAVSVAGLGRWEYDPASQATVLDDQCRLLLGASLEQSQDFNLMLPMIHEDARIALVNRLEKVLSDGQEFEQIFRVHRPDGRYRWLRGMGRLVLRDGQPKILGVSVDVTAEQELLAERELHLDEMNHRIKNLFALVSAMISNAERESESIDGLVEKLRSRVMALDRAHSLMLKNAATQPVQLRDLLESIVAPGLGVQPVTLAGTDGVEIPVKSLTPLVLIVHEWVTNSIKYGALQQHDGEIHVSWTRDGDALKLMWREKVDCYDAETARGFGSRLIEASAMQLGATKTRRHEDGWLTIEMSMPLCVGT